MEYGASGATRVPKPAPKLKMLKINLSKSFKVDNEAIKWIQDNYDEGKDYIIRNLKNNPFRINLTLLGELQTAFLLKYCIMQDVDSEFYLIADFDLSDDLGLV